MKIRKSIAKISALLIISAVSIIFSSCTQNNGNIGELFGTWYVESIEINGEPSDGYNANIFFAFQSSATTMTQVYEYNVTNTIYGDWSREGDTLYLRYEDSVYPPLTATGLAPTVNACKVTELTNDVFIFEYTNSSNQLYRYTLTKR